MLPEDKSVPVLISGKVHPDLAVTFQRIVRFVGGNPNHAMSEIVKTAGKDRDFQAWLAKNKDQQPSEAPMPKGKRRGKSTPVAGAAQAQTA